MNRYEILLKKEPPPKALIPPVIKAKSDYFMGIDIGVRESKVTIAIIHRKDNDYVLDFLEKVEAGNIDQFHFVLHYLNGKYPLKHGLSDYHPPYGYSSSDLFRDFPILVESRRVEPRYDVLMGVKISEEMPYKDASLFRDLIRFLGIDTAAYGRNDYIDALHRALMACEGYHAYHGYKNAQSNDRLLWR